MILKEYLLNEVPCKVHHIVKKKKETLANLLLKTKTSTKMLNSNDNQKLQESIKHSKTFNLDSRRRSFRLQDEELKDNNILNSYANINIYKENIETSECNFNAFLSNLDMTEKHTNIVDSYLYRNQKEQKTNYKNDKILLVEVGSVKEHENYNLFFVDKGELFEFQSTELKIIKHNFQDDFTFHNLQEFIYKSVKKNSNTKFNYLEELTFFSLEDDPQLLLNKKWDSFIQSEEFLNLYYRQHGMYKA